MSAFKEKGDREGEGHGERERERFMPLLFHNCLSSEMFMSNSTFGVTYWGFLPLSSTSLECTHEVSSVCCLWLTLKSPVCLKTSYMFTVWSDPDRGGPAYCSE